MGDLSEVTEKLRGKLGLAPRALHSEPSVLSTRTTITTCLSDSHMREDDLALTWLQPVRKSLLSHTEEEESAALRPEPPRQPSAVSGPPPSFPGTDIFCRMLLSLLFGSVGVFQGFCLLLLS